MFVLLFVIVFVLLFYRVSVSCSSLRFDLNLDLVLLVQFHLCGFYSPDVARKVLVHSHSVLAVVDINCTY